MNATLTLAPALLLAGLAASALTTDEAPQPDPTPIAAAGSYKVDSGHSFVMFRVMHLGIGAAYGQFRDLKGELVYDADQPANNSISLTIDAASIDTNSADRDKHLRGADFFSVKEFPEITFQSTKIESAGENEFKITGMLKMHGVEKEVIAKGKLLGAGKDPWGNTRVGLEADFKVDRLAFGVDYMPEGLGKEVHVVVALEGILNK